MPARSKSSKQRTAESILAEKAAAAAAAAASAPGPAEPIQSAKSKEPVKSKAKVRVEEEDVESEESNFSGSEGSEGSEGSDDDFGTGLLDGVDLDNALSNYFMYQHDDGTVLNITDAILLTKESIDRQTECLEKLCELIATKLKSA